MSTHTSPGTESDTSEVDDAIKKWHLDKPKSKQPISYPTDDLELFAATYHKLVHSSALDSIHQLEHTFATVIHQLVKERDEELFVLSRNQTVELSQALEGLSLGLTEADITEMAKRHQEEHGIEIASWQSRLESISNQQKSEFRDWVMSLFGDRSLTTPLSSPIIEFQDLSETFGSVGPNLQESFTIHLGSQMKQMYNIRLMSGDALDLCRLRTNSEGHLSKQPQRYQTALNLYSNDLSGLVLLCDNHLGRFSGITKDFVRVCEMSTELHFNNVEKQLNDIRDWVKKGISWRKHNIITDNINLTTSEQQARKSDSKYLQTGDVYVTKHSNLSEVHVVFHMVVGDSIKSNDINSRHPGILGLRNLIKCACYNDVTTLTIPILLTHELFEEMTMAWCVKRAELVFKCVKGFMIEMASWGGTELKNLQFLVPKGLSEEVFSTLASMLPSIFRVSNPMVMKSKCKKSNCRKSH